MSARRLLAKAKWRDRIADKRTWLEIDSRAAKANVAVWRRLIGPKVKLWAVVKSNAYGHGLASFGLLLDRLGVDGFCIDSAVEGLKLRSAGAKKPILVLGSTLPNMLPRAAASNIAVSVSSPEALSAIGKLSHPPDFHIKVDTGMHRQGFYLNDLPRVIKEVKKKPLLGRALGGIFTHFAAAKDIAYPTYTERQFAEFEAATDLMKASGFENIVRHAAASGGTLLGSRYHLDAVRIGIGLYGLWPSAELELELGGDIVLKPVMSWRSLVSEVKKIRSGDFVGYDITERVRRPTQLAIVPIGYWHGFPRALSSIGEVLVRGRRAKVLGRVSMDMIAIDVTGIPAKVGEPVTLIGRDGRNEIAATDLARLAGASHYEMITRLNPLMERIII